MPKTAEKLRLDRIDRRILEQLQDDGRLSNQELAERVALSPSPCLRRVRGLERAGIIRGYAALLDPLQVGLGLLAFVSVKLEKRGKMPVDQFMRAVQAWPEVIACFSMTGDMDYLSTIRASSWTSCSSSPASSTFAPISCSSGSRKPPRCLSRTSPDALLRHRGLAPRPGAVRRKANS
jgi:Lrp/AsnC family leucine-responsive transcriptional regulator